MAPTPNPSPQGGQAALEQFSELRDARNGTPHHSILRPAPCFALAPLAKKTLRLFVKCSNAGAVHMAVVSLAGRFSSVARGLDAAVFRFVCGPCASRPTAS
ncbi:hypothetical protein DVJ83_00505 [Deinococcus wulumuqiensis]|uniref:Uncharacterized protein n=1 Tax=Deinococcus wulumuqiensis TaxID=980427 RepID=A0A345IDX7_9DEIO|nr:hypothetical protein DVJ83_00505 [Deinococcus wulumuqiensis]